jgi:hypothetical protein
VIRTVRGHLAVEPFKELRRGIVQAENAGDSPVAVKDPGDEHQLADELGPAQRDHQRHDRAIAAAGQMRPARRPPVSRDAIVSFAITSNVIDLSK